MFQAFISRTKKGTDGLLLSPSAMEKLLAKERVRCDRYLQHFALVVLERMEPAKRASEREVLIGNFLRKRLRLSDDAGFLSKGGIGVLLPMTDRKGAAVVLEDIKSFAANQGFSVQGEIYSYEGHDGLGARDDADLPGGDGVMEPAIALRSRQASEVSGEAEFQTESDVATERRLRLDRPVVRADQNTQKPMAANSSSKVVTRFCCPEYPMWKRIFDITLALAGLMVTWPILVIAAIAIKLTTRGPILFCQTRTGQFGKPFVIYKLRTMIVDAEELKHLLYESNERDGPAFKMKHDPRVTTVGRWMRKVGVDELPQLWNVLCGDMAIVGPRPLPTSEDAQCASWQQSRLDTRPGLTCTWQVSKSRKISFREWMRLDVRYRNKRSFQEDCSLILKTIAAVFLGRVGH